MPSTGGRNYISSNDEDINLVITHNSAPNVPIPNLRFPIFSPRPHYMTISQRNSPEPPRPTSPIPNSRVSSPYQIFNEPVIPTFIDTHTSPTTIRTRERIAARRRAAPWKVATDPYLPDLEDRRLRHRIMLSSKLFKNPIKDAIDTDPALNALYDLYHLGDRLENTLERHNAEYREDELFSLDYSIRDIKEKLQQLTLTLMEEQGFFEALDGLGGTEEDRRHAGEPKPGEKLAEVLLELPVDVLVALFSATLPQDMLQQIIKSLNLPRDLTDTFMLTTNRPNVSHAVIPMVNSIKNFSNLDFLVSKLFHPSMSYPPKSLIFIDHKLSTAVVARYLNTRLPEAVQHVFKFWHLHSSMSMEHNKMVFNEFQKPDRLVQGIVATSGASTGINVCDIQLVVQFGITINISEHEQCTGRGGQDWKPCHVLMIVEKWAYKITIDAQVLHKGKPTAKERCTNPAMLDSVNTSTCHQQFLAEYNSDTTAEAFEYNSTFCCDQHLDTTSNINYFLPGKMLPSIALQVRLKSETSSVHPQAQPKKTCKKYCPTKQRPPLEELLQAWRKSALSNDVLAREEEAAFESTADVVLFLEESSKWANSYAEQMPFELESENDEPEQHLPDIHVLADHIPSLIKTTSDLYDTDTTLVNSYSPTSSPQSSQCATPDLNLPLSAAVQHPHSESVFESPNPRPKKRAFIAVFKTVGTATKTPLFQPF
ncbi:uncharacterized protein EDB91DRAFT_1249783 [Suillus paluster]|uniref:uncharacterized protein n=1 Tax=Suillus paluster TaxID=48578 RepID=UPI001B87E719|nr:uncharacterized protein EDB91DRAFT_1249783 [Suillus paluster]KAG1737135.1 hypothetical protein EDB91DRAFT_1249783 [Suillus paluster]